jgi:hypothetical protein
VLAMASAGLRASFREALPLLQLAGEEFDAGDAEFHWKKRRRATN